MPTTQPPTLPYPTEIPKPLPQQLLPHLLRHRRMLLCLDYDGTLSEITDRPFDARPVRQARDHVAALSGNRDRIEVAIVSGRDIDTVRNLLGLEHDLIFIGNHGIEIADITGKRHVAPGVEAAEADLARVRKWIGREVPKGSGFVVEDKRSTIALHYRVARPSVASVVRSALRKFLQDECPRVEILAGKMVDEVIPRGLGGKGDAVRQILDSMSESNPVAVYFGDDTTDEDAFFALRDAGVTVRVGAPRRSWAQYRVADPAAVVTVLSSLVSVLEASER